MRRSRKSASHRPSQAFCFLRGPAFLFCGNLLSLANQNGCARPFIFPGWFVPSGSRSDRAGPGLGRGRWGWKSCYVIGRGNTATAYLQAGMIRPVPDATADAVVDVQGGSGRRVPRTPKVSCFACGKTRREKRGTLQAGWRKNNPAPHCGGARFRRKFIGREYN